MHTTEMGPSEIMHRWRQGERVPGLTELGPDRLLVDGDRLTPSQRYVSHRRGGRFGDYWEDSFVSADDMARARLVDWWRMTCSLLGTEESERVEIESTPIHRMAVEGVWRWYALIEGWPHELVPRLTMDDDLAITAKPTM